MGARGPYAKGKAKRAEILDVALEVIARDGYSAATVKNLADAAGLSQNGLLHYFGSKDALFAEILRHEDEVTAIETDADNRNFADDLVTGILDAIETEITSPGMTQLALRVTGEATEPEHVAHDYLRNRYETIRLLVRNALIDLQTAGRVAADVDADAVSALVFASWDGLRTQWLYDNTIDVRAHMVYLLRALGVDAPVVAEATAQAVPSAPR
ncbi:TetR/AcrR family transcriptional regulator [Leifsonia poae]|uniref:Transcriptional regulator, TetR family protein n=1 Tax=Leifsonia poae TaxID=110933 RepID=A0A9W6M033_9MICO|nr:TetR/AcrR family transcriptional regulator [Leifsonia poae]GLJ76244.1 putative transcriptional regulator, TetR family protein [Leifsonia poae]